MSTRAFHHRSGYVLVVTLALLVLSASLMVAVSRAALAHATAARLGADELQHRWGVVSCRTALLPYAETILLTAESQHHVATPVIHGRVQLGEELFDLSIADELAKVNVNLYFDHADRSTAETRLRQALAGFGLVQNIRLRPDGRLQTADAPATSPSTQPTNTLPQWVTGYGQIFADASPEVLLTPRNGTRIVDLLTCWGGGQLNLRRIPAAVLQMAAGTNLSGIAQNKLLAMRDLDLQGKPLPLPSPKTPLSKDPALRLIQAAGVDSKGLDKLPPLVAESRCHSIWIVTQDKRRTWHYLSILDRSDKDHPRSAAFVW